MPAFVISCWQPPSSAPYRRSDMKLTAQIVPSLFTDDGDAPAGHVRRNAKSLPHGHSADGMTASVSLGGEAMSTIIDPQSFENGGPEWVCRCGNVESIRYTVASLLESCDYLLTGNISMKEATRRLRLLRAGRAALSDTEGK